MFRIFKKNKKSAFSLVEIIVVLFIISLGLVGVLSLIVQNIQSQNLNKNNLVAYQLAQEGIELIRRVRDTNWKNGQEWDHELNAASYYIDYLDTKPHRIDNSSEIPNKSKLYQDLEGYYYHDNAAPSSLFSGFRRLISIVNLDDDSIYVRARITWAEKNKNFSYDLETILYDWQ